MQRAGAFVECSRKLLRRGPQSCLQQLRYQTDGRTQQAKAAIAAEQAAAAEDSTPPSAARAVATMGAGALGAVAIAAVGVWGVFKMAMAVAEGTGRTLNSNGSASPAAASVSVPYSSEANDLLPMQPAVPSGPVYPPSPQHRKAELQADLQALYQMPRSPVVEEQKATIRQELQSLR